MLGRHLFKGDIRDMLKKYEKTVIEIIVTNNLDILTTSNGFGKIEITEKDTWND